MALGSTAIDHEKADFGCTRVLRQWGRFRAIRQTPLFDRSGIWAASNVVAQPKTCARAKVGGLGLWVLQEPQIERRKYQDYSDVNHKPFPKSIPKEK
jgi:hypothetical protein